MGLLSAIAGPIVGGIFSSIAGNKARKNAKEDAKHKFEDLRASAERAGFNPLTALQATGGAGFGNYGSGGAAPLATAEFLSQAATSVAREMTGEAEIERVNDRANAEMATIALERMRSGVSDVGSPYMPMQTRNAPKMIVGGNTQVKPQRMGKTVHETPIPPSDTPYKGRVSPIDKNRGFEADPVISVPGVMEMQNDFTGPKPIYLPGSDGEVMGFDEVLTTGVIGGPQMIYNNIIYPKLEAIREKVTPSWDAEKTDRFNDWYETLPKTKTGKSRVNKF